MNAPETVSPPVPTVFVVDDESGMRSALRRLFVAAGLNVRVFASAREFLDAPDLTRPGVLVLDVRMPEMSGIELHAALRERQNDVPIIFLTGASTVPMAVTAMRQGAVDFLEKPIDNAPLVTRVRQVLETDAASATLRERHALHAGQLATLTARERQVLDLVLTGRTSKEIARVLGGSHRTMEIHRGRVMNKMRADSPAELVRLMLVLEREPQAQ